MYFVFFNSKFYFIKYIGILKFLKIFFFKNYLLYGSCTQHGATQQRNSEIWILIHGPHCIYTQIINPLNQNTSVVRTHWYDHCNSVCIVFVYSVEWHRHMMLVHVCTFTLDLSMLDWVIQYMFMNRLRYVML